MQEGTITFYIGNRMRELGYEAIHLTIERKTAHNEVIQIKAHNEWWFLFDLSQGDDDFTIIADNRIITLDDFTSAGVAYAARELTGNIDIDNTGAAASQDFIFYRIIPE